MAKKIFYEILQFIIISFLQNNFIIRSVMNYVEMKIN